MGPTLSSKVFERKQKLGEGGRELQGMAPHEWQWNSLQKESKSSGYSKFSVNEGGHMEAVRNVLEGISA